MPRATIILDIPGQANDADDWFAAWRDRMTFISDNCGCGCCVDIYNVEGPQEAIDAIPAELRTASKWSASASPPSKDA